jgi:hypothetical protein
VLLLRVGARARFGRSRTATSRNRGNPSLVQYAHDRLRAVQRRPRHVREQVVFDVVFSPPRAMSVSRPPPTLREAGTLSSQVVELLGCGQDGHALVKARRINRHQPRRNVESGDAGQPRGGSSLDTRPAVRAMCRWHLQSSAAAGDVTELRSRPRRHCCGQLCLIGDAGELRLPDRRQPVGLDVADLFGGRRTSRPY